MEGMGSLLTFCESTCIVNIITKAETRRWTKQCKKYTSIKPLSCVWLHIVYIYNYIQHKGDVATENYTYAYSLFVLCITLNVALCRANFEEIASYMKGWADLAYRLRKTLNTLHTIKLKTLEHEKVNDNQCKKSGWIFNNK